MSKVTPIDDGERKPNILLKSMLKGSLIDLAKEKQKRANAQRNKERADHLNNLIKTAKRTVASMAYVCGGDAAMLLEMEKILHPHRRVKS